MPNIPIFLSADDNYAPFVATTIASICYNTKSFIDFYVLDSGITKENQEKICSLKNQFNNFSVEFIKINKEMLSKIDYKNGCSHVSIATYNRFLIPILKPQIEKLIYIDVDIIALGDITELYNYPLGNYSLGAVVEPFGSCSMVPYGSYFNAGVLLINNKKWLESNVHIKLFDIENTYRNIIKFADQDVLNIAFKDNYLSLSENFNFTSKNLIKKNSIVLRHFNTAIKPWQISEKENSSVLLNHDDFWFYARKTRFYNKIYKMAELSTPQALRHLKILSLQIKRLTANEK